MQTENKQSINVSPTLVFRGHVVMHLFCSCDEFVNLLIEYTVFYHDTYNISPFHLSFITCNKLFCLAMSYFLLLQIFEVPK